MRKTRADFGLVKKSLLGGGGERKNRFFSVLSNSGGVRKRKHGDVAIDAVDRHSDVEGEWIERSSRGENK